jgi:hypothetical protein
LLWAITSAGRCTASIVAAIVIVLPVPVAPSSVSEALAGLDPSASDRDRAGWSAAGVKASSKSGIRSRA